MTKAWKNNNKNKGLIITGESDSLDRTTILLAVKKMCIVLFLKWNSWKKECLSIQNYILQEHRAKDICLMAPAGWQKMEKKFFISWAAPLLLSTLWLLKYRQPKSIPEPICTKCVYWDAGGFHLHLSVLPTSSILEWLL